MAYVTIKMGCLLHGLRHDFRPSFLRQDLKHGEEGEGERFELVQT
jgi:hypothetical protein